MLTAQPSSGSSASQRYSGVSRKIGSIVWRAARIRAVSSRVAGSATGPDGLDQRERARVVAGELEDHRGDAGGGELGRAPGDLPGQVGRRRVQLDVDRHPERVGGAP